MYCPLDSSCLRGSRNPEAFSGIFGDTYGQAAPLAERAILGVQVNWAQFIIAYSSVALRSQAAMVARPWVFVLPAICTRASAASVKG